MQQYPHKRFAHSVRILLVACFLLISGIFSLEIKDLKVPTMVESGSSEPLILDCDYVYEDHEKLGLVVKWYYESGPSDNRSTQQVYQWITTFQPQDLGALKGRLNIDYVASSDPYKKHRALNILEPTNNLTGVYKCHVSTNFNDAVKAQKMVVYSPAEDMKLTKTKLDDNRSVNISCTAEGVYPKPDVEMVIIRGRKTSRTLISDATELINFNEGLYDVVLYKIFNDASLAAETQFECVLTIPETTYSLRKSLIYYPGLDSEPHSEAKSAVRTISNVGRDKNDPTISDLQSSNGRNKVATLCQFLSFSIVVILTHFACKLHL